MFTNFLKVTLRNLYREKMYAMINITGLSIAIACCLILGIYLKSELTYDRYNVKYKQIFRVVTEYTVNGKSGTLAMSPFALGLMLKEEYSEIKGFVRIMGGGIEDYIKHGDKAFSWKNAFFADQNIFDVFTFDVIYGDPKTALVDPSSVAVSESFARKYFGNVNPIGETITNNMDTFKIALVFADLPENSHLRYDVIYSYNRTDFAQPDNVTARNLSLWSLSCFTYLVMPEGYDVKKFTDIYKSFYARHMEETGKSLNASMKFMLQPLADIHLNSEAGYDLPTGNRLYLYGFMAVAIFILLVACINYMNLTTARATKRAKEVGMRKILGSSRIDLILQFLCESILFSLVAFFLGIVLVELALNLTSINELLNKTLTLNLSREPRIFGWMLAFALSIGILSGIYPAIYLSSMVPLSTLVKSKQTGKRNIIFRELLVLIQFIISVSVIACVFLMSMQMRYISNKSLGYSKEDRLVITLQGADVIDKLPAITNELSKNGNILGMSVSNIKMGENTGLTVAKIENNDGVLEDTPFMFMQVGDDYLGVMGMQLIAGRDFTKKYLTDSGTSYIVNEAMVKKMGWKEPIGKHIQLETGYYKGRIIGVVKDFHFASLHSKVEPFAMFPLKIDTQTLSSGARAGIQTFLVLHISGDGIPQTLAFLQEKFAEFDPKHPFKYEFLDESLDKLYMSEARLMKLIAVFAGVCIFISCMGLFGLAAFATEQRTKEIGVRKVLGASTWQIIVMLARRILMLVLAGAVIASLVAYYAADEWLSGFAYRIGIDPLVFLLTALVAAGVAFLTVAIQSFKTAHANPIEALRYE